MKIAFVCDWLTGMRGGERCLEAMCEVYPQAEIYALVYYPEHFDGQFSSHKVHTSFIQKLPGGYEKFRFYLPLFPKAIESFDFSGYDFVLSFSHCVAKSILVPKSVTHICYCHSPVRYAWDMKETYLRSLPKIKRTIANFMLNKLKKWDLKTANRPDFYIANSNFIKDRIKRNYNIDATVIYPPVDCSKFTPSDNYDDYYLVVSALTPYKRIDLAVKAFSSMKKRLIVIGKGSELNKLKYISGNNIEFVENATDMQVVSYMSKAKAIIFPGKEDFGIVPLEAQASGKPVIAFAKGGALETVNGLNCCDNTNVTGIFFYEQNTESLINAVKLFETNIQKFSCAACYENAKSFDKEAYKANMKNFIDSKTKKWFT